MEDWMDPSDAKRETGCERVLGRLPELTDGALSPLDEALDRGHLEACASCSDEAASWAEFHTSLCEAVPRDGALDPGLFHGLDRRLAEVVMARQPVESSRTRMLTSLVGAAASLVVLFGLEALGATMDDGNSGLLLAPATVESESDGFPQTKSFQESLGELVMDLFPKGLQEKEQ